MRQSIKNLNKNKHLAGDLHASIAPKYVASELYGVIPTDTRKPFDVREIIARVVDGSEFDEFKARFGATLICGFARIEGMPVGIIANNGILFSESALKGAHFIELCCQRKIPLGVFAKHHRLHGRAQVRKRRHCPQWGQDGHRRGYGRRTQVHHHHWRQLWCGQLRHVRPGLFTPFLVDVAECAHQRHGWRAGGQCVGNGEA